ncbi:16S rRNA (cytidine(1402)-2'-O)-methyltransferase, partial [Patescibacteria group bacterium]|nr:16S rRNA (cytidine(1402)-2'-O)-methyltransferase [Patescibacteria group bacterium]
LGFPPQKKGRAKFFKEIVENKRPAIFYESPYRILKSLRELGELDPKLSLVVGRELTKVFETIYRGSIEQVIKQLEKEKQRGEFVVVVYQER